MTVIIKGSEYTYTVSATISIVDEDSDENYAYHEVKHLLEKAGFTNVEVDLYDTQPNIEDLD